MPTDKTEQVQETQEVEQEAKDQSLDEKSKEDTSANTKQEDQGKIDSNKLAEKLQARLTKEQADKNVYKDKYEAVKQELDQLKQGKSVKELHEKDKNDKMIAEKDKLINDLQAKIKRNETLKQVDGIFKDADLNVSDEILNLVVSDDSETTVNNAKAIIDLVNSSFDRGRQTILKGKTPKASVAHSVQSTSPNKMTLLDRAKLHKEDPESYLSVFGKKG